MIGFLDISKHVCPSCQHHYAESREVLTFREWRADPVTWCVSGLVCATLGTCSRPSILELDSFYAATMISQGVLACDFLRICHELCTYRP